MQAQQPGKGRPQLGAGDDLVQKAVLLQVFRALEALGQGLTDGLLDYPGTGKTDQRPNNFSLYSDSNFLFPSNNFFSI